jgi:4-hydroxybenzoate polyprenyltransferase
MDVRRILLDAYRFYRFSAFGATATLPLLGAASTTPTVPLATIAVLLLVAALFHGFAYVHNDIVDLAVDRTQPLRRDYPLVRGTIQLRQAWLFVAFCLLGLAALCLLGRPAALPFVLIAVLCMIGYNLWGKRCAWSILTDALQGLGWAALIGYGALASGGPISRLVCYLGSYEVVLILLVNGVHGSLRDLANDAACGARSTALWLGARIDDGKLRIPSALLGYALVLQLLLAVLVLLPLLDGTIVYPALVQGLTLAALLALQFLMLWLAWAAQRHRDAASLKAIGMLHLTALLTAPILLVLPGCGPWLALALLIAHTMPLLANGMTYDGLRWLFEGKNREPRTENREPRTEN